jgi:hypothetical protein
LASLAGAAAAGGGDEGAGAMAFDTTVSGVVDLFGWHDITDSRDHCRTLYVPRQPAALPSGHQQFINMVLMKVQYRKCAP